LVFNVNIVELLTLISRFAIIPSLTGTVPVLKACPRV
jgi:hypothetical protein